MPPKRRRAPSLGGRSLYKRRRILPRSSGLWMRGLRTARKGSGRRRPRVSKIRRIVRGYKSSRRRKRFVQRIKKALQPNIRLRKFHHFDVTVGVAATNGTQNWIVSTGGYALDLQAMDTTLNTAGITSVNQEVWDFKGYKSTTWLSNRSNIPIWTVSYLCVPRNDMDSTASGTSASFYEPGIAFSAGITNITGSALAGTVGITPFESDYFKKNFKVLRVTRAIIKPGRVLTKTLKHGPAQVSRTKWAATGSASIKGFTRFWLTIFHGQFLGINTLTTGTTSICQIQYGAHKIYKLRNTSDKWPDLDFTYITGTALPTVGDPEIWEDYTEQKAQFS